MDKKVELAEKLNEIIVEYLAEGLTIPEVIGVLETLKFTLFFSASASFKILEKSLKNAKEDLEEIKDIIEKIIKSKKKGGDVKYIR